MKAQRLVIVGAGVAGHAVAEEARSQGFAGGIMLLNGEEHVPYDRPALSKTYLTTATRSPSRLREESWGDSLNLSLLTGVQARALDTRNNTLRLSDGSDLEYDRLAICTGARARRLPVPLRSPGIISLRTVADADALHRQTASSRTAVVIGAGLLGMEIAASLRRAGLSVTILCRDTVPLGNALGSTAGEWFAGLHARHGVRIMRRVVPCAISGGPYHWTIETSAGESLAADVIVSAVGAEPNVEWLTGSGIAVDAGVLCNEYCETNVPGVVAAGDVASRVYLPDTPALRSEHWTHGVEMGKAAGRTLAGNLRPFSPVPYFWTDQYSAAARFAGRTGEHERVLTSTPDQLLIEYVRDEDVCGVLAVNAPRDFLRVRRGLAAPLRVG